MLGPPLLGVGTRTVREWATPPGMLLLGGKGLQDPCITPHPRPSFYFFVCLGTSHACQRCRGVADRGAFSNEGYLLSVYVPHVQS